jgi:hypothetical protein
MSCPNRDALLTALHCGERAEADCRECATALADERRFVEAVEIGLGALRPMARIAPIVRARIAPKRIVRRARRNPWPVAVAAAMLLGVAAAAVALFPRREPPKEMARPPEEPRRVEEPRRPEPVVVEKPIIPERPPEVPKEIPKPVEREKPPEEPKPEVPKPPVRETVPEPAPTMAAVTVKSGALALNGKKVGAVEERVEVRAEGRTRVEFARTSVTIDAGSRVSFEGHAMTLVDGEMMVEGPADAPIELRLAATVTSATGAGQFVVLTRRDRIVVEEGAVACGGRVLGEAKQWRLGAEVKEEKRSFGEKWRAMRPRETVTWSATFDTGKAPAGTTVEGVFAQRALKSAKLEKNSYFYGGAYLLSDERRLFVAQATTHLRFRYLMRKPARFVVQAHDMTFDENFELEIAKPVIGEWTTLTLRVMDLPVNAGGQKVVVGAGDPFSWVRWLVGKPGEEAEVAIDDVQVVEIKGK